MTFVDKLLAAERKNRSLLCVGLDPDPARFPGALRGDPARLFDFCAGVVEATSDLVIAFKPQIAYFAAERAEDQLERLIVHIHAVAPDVPVILDAKRGDIGRTAERYAREVFERYRADAVTLSPLLGFDSIEPYLRHPGKGVILLCRTSNPGGADLQELRLASGEPVFERIARLAAGQWNASGQVGLVVGATYPAEIARVRELAPRLPLLIPGIGAQGGDAAATVRAGWRGTHDETTAPIVVSSSRAVLYADADDGTRWQDAVRRAAQAARAELEASRAEIATSGADVATGQAEPTAGGADVPAGSAAPTTSATDVPAGRSALTTSAVEVATGAAVPASVAADRPLVDR